LYAALIGLAVFLRAANRAAPFFMLGPQEVAARMDFTELKELLSGATVFSILSGDELEQLSERCELVHYTLGQTICRAGDKADAFYIVYSGRARVVAINPQNEEVTVGKLTRGNSFGEQGLLTNSSRRYTVRAASDLALLRLNREDFERLLESRPELRDYFEKYISEISIRNFLKLCTVLSPLSPAEIRDLLGSIQIKQFGAGEAVLREGAPGDAFYILRSGSAKVIKESNGSRVLKRLKTGDAYGTAARGDGHRRRAADSISSRQITV
jgi:subfamily B ATP-binding cassette protein HlyB/CyaB